MCGIAFTSRVRCYKNLIIIVLEGQYKNIRGAVPSIAGNLISSTKIEDKYLKKCNSTAKAQRSQREIRDPDNVLFLKMIAVFIYFMI